LEGDLFLLFAGLAFLSGTFMLGLAYKDLKVCRKKRKQ